MSSIREREFERSKRFANFDNESVRKKKEEQRRLENEYHYHSLWLNSNKRLNAVKAENDRLNAEIDRLNTEMAVLTQKREKGAVNGSGIAERTENIESILDNSTDDD